MSMRLNSMSFGAFWFFFRRIQLSCVCYSNQIRMGENSDISSSSIQVELSRVVDWYFAIKSIFCLYVRALISYTNWKFIARVLFG